MSGGSNAHCDMSIPHAVRSLGNAQNSSRYVTCLLLHATALQCHKNPELKGSYNLTLHL